MTKARRGTVVDFGPIRREDLRPPITGTYAVMYDDRLLTALTPPTYKSVPHEDFDESVLTKKAFGCKADPLFKHYDFKGGYQGHILLLPFKTLQLDRDDPAAGNLRTGIMHISGPHEQSISYAAQDLTQKIRLAMPQPPTEQGQALLQRHLAPYRFQQLEHIFHMLEIMYNQRKRAEEAPYANPAPRPEDYAPPRTPGLPLPHNP